jgi:hypothetical protein
MKSRPLSVLILAVAVTLWILLLTEGSDWISTIAVTITLVTLILVIGDEARYLDSVLGTILDQLRKIIRP